MKLPFLSLGVLLAARLIFPVASAAEPRLRVIGVLGNSGVEGPALIRTESWPGSRRGADYGGVILDPAGTLWFQSGKALLRTSLDGRLLATVHFGPECAGVAGRGFARLGSRLYFIGATSSKEFRPAALFALDTATLEEPRAVWNFADLLPPKGRIVLAGETGKEERLLLAYSRPPADKEPGPTLFVVGWLHPGEGRFEPIVQWEGSGADLAVHGVALNPENGHFYVGGSFGRYVSGSTWAANRMEIIEFSPEGKELRRRDALPLPAIPSRFRGSVNFAGGAVWDAAGYGFTGRLKPEDLEPDPGITTSWDHSLDNVSQFVGIREQAGLPATDENRRLDPLLIALRPYSSLYYAVYDGERKTLALQTRIGSLPEVSALALSPEGWVSVGTHPMLQLWWKWEDGAASPPRFGSVNVRALSGGRFRDNQLSVLAEKSPYRRPDQPAVLSTVILWPTPGRSGSSRPAHEMPPLEKIGGYAVDDARPRPRAWISGSGGQASLWRSPMNAKPWAPTGQWEPVEVEGGSLSDPGEIVVFSDGHVAIAEPGAVVWLRQEDEKLVWVRRITGWGKGETFGKTLRLAGGPGNTLLIADAERHHVLAWSPSSDAPLARFGHSDTPGDALDALHTPGAIAASDNRVIVYDSGNQRILKLVLVAP